VDGGPVLGTERRSRGKQKCEENWRKSEAKPIEEAMTQGEAAGMWVGWQHAFSRKRILSGLSAMDEKG
jgi:hypothetical protein